MNTLVKRTLSGMLFLIIVVGCLLCAYSYVALMSFLIVALSVEYFKLTVPGKRFLKEKVCVVACGLVFFLSAFLSAGYGLPPKVMLTSFIPVIVAFIFMLFDCKSDYDINAHIFFPLLYVALPVSSTVLMTLAGGAYSYKIILGLFFLAWTNDVGAYIFGMGFGQRPGSKKLFPALSPKKSWIGAIGGTVLTFAVALLLWAVWSEGKVALWHWFDLAFIVSFFGVCGDLFESLIKRHAQVKDSGNIIPGHGGLLDRFDDILFIMPSAAIYLTLLSVL
jgi:CDP-diglyceride synthetase